MELICNKCKKSKSCDLFHKNKASRTGFHNYCKACRKGAENERKLERYYKNKEVYNERAKRWKQDNKERWNEYCRDYRASDSFTYKTPAIRANRAKRRAIELQATPKWSDISKIKRIYELCADMNSNSSCKFEVDHIHPLQGENFKGLHVWFNLMILPKKLNASKGNKLTKNIMFPRVLDNFEQYLSELKMYAELAENQLQELQDKKPVG